MLVPLPGLGERGPGGHGEQVTPVELAGYRPGLVEDGLVASAAGGLDGGGFVEGAHHRTLEVTQDGSPTTRSGYQGRRRGAPTNERARALEQADRLVHLLRRATWGPTPDLVAGAARLGRGAWLEQQLNPTSIADPEGDAVVARFPSLALSSAQVRSRYSNGSWDVMFDLAEPPWAAPRGAVGSCSR